MGRHAGIMTIRSLAGLALILVLPSIIAAHPDPSLTLTSAAFANGGPIPRRYTCAGANRSPALKWMGVPEGARSMALIVADPDAPMGTFIHWVAYNLSPTNGGLPEAAAESTGVKAGEQGVNGRGTSGYTGPCPPPGKPHHYHFHLYALDQKLDLRPGASATEVEAAAQGHILASTELVGIFGR